MRAVRLMIAAMCVTLLCGATLVRAAEQPESESVRFAATLLTLFRQSDAIYLARFDKREDGRVLMTDSSYTVVEIETELTILSTLKGEDRKLLTLTDEDFRYRLAAQPDSGYAPEVRFAVNAASTDRSKTPEPGDTVLVFVRQAGSPDNYEIVDSRDGIKKLLPDDQSIYVDRIKELNSIFSAKQPQPSAIAAWLVKCAEEPATRWDAAFELERGFRQLDRQDRRKDADKAAAISNEVAGDLLPVAQAITDGQKSSLTNILFNSGRGNSTNGNLSAADRQLIKLVRRWAPRETVVHLLDRLKAGPSATGDDAYIMQTIAAVTDDPEAAQYAQRYSQLSVSEVLTADGVRDPRQVVLEQFVERVERSLNSVNLPNESR